MIRLIKRFPLTSLLLFVLLAAGALMFCTYATDTLTRDSMNISDETLQAHKPIVIVVDPDSGKVHSFKSKR